MTLPVALVKYTQSPDSLRTALELCDGFGELDQKASVLIKPNLVTWETEQQIPPFGVYTTTRLVEDLVILLNEFGCKDITIGEGSVPMRTGSATVAAFEGLGYTAIAAKYGVKLVDFNESAAANVQTEDGISLSIAREALETDFFIDMPVLKTHAQTKVSLGIKNLKGCLKLASKRACHDPEQGHGLEHAFQFLPDFLKPALTIVDGIYALERGALQFGTAYRKDVIVASRDLLVADIVAAKTIGYNPEDITHFQEYGARKELPLDLSNVDVRGEDLESLVTPLKWDWSWTEDNTGPTAFERAGVQGVTVPKYDETLCSGCSQVPNMVNVLVLSAFQGKNAPVPLPSVEVLNGKKMLASPGHDSTILVGRYAGLPVGWPAGWLAWQARPISGILTSIMLSKSRDVRRITRLSQQHSLKQE